MLNLRGCVRSIFFRVGRWCARSFLFSYASVGLCSVYLLHAAALSCRQYFLPQRHAYTKVLQPSLVSHTRSSNTRARARTRAHAVPLRGETDIGILTVVRARGCQSGASTPSTLLRPALMLAPSYLCAQPRPASRSGRLRTAHRRTAPLSSFCMRMAPCVSPLAPFALLHSQLPELHVLFFSGLDVCIFHHDPLGIDRDLDSPILSPIAAGEADAAQTRSSLRVSPRDVPRGALQSARTSIHSRSSHRARRAVVQLLCIASSDSLGAGGRVWLHWRRACAHERGGVGSLHGAAAGVRAP